MYETFIVVLFDCKGVITDFAKHTVIGIIVTGTFLIVSTVKITYISHINNFAA